MNMPDFEDASPSHFQPDGAAAMQPVAIFAALAERQGDLRGSLDGPRLRGGEEGQDAQLPDQQLAGAVAHALWPARPAFTCATTTSRSTASRPRASFVVVVLWTLNNYDALKRAGTGVYFYIPKLQTPAGSPDRGEASRAAGGHASASRPAPSRSRCCTRRGMPAAYLPAIAWVLRRRLLGTNVGRWDYLGSLIEMWKDDPRGVFPDPQADRHGHART